MLGQNVCQRRSAALSVSERAVIFVLTAFNLFSIAYSAKLRNVLYVLSSIASLLLVFVPYLLEWVFKIRISLGLKITYSLFPLLGPVLGNVYKFYHIVPYWDKFLHSLSGFAFAALGYCLIDLMERGRTHSKTVKAMFAFCFSMMIAGVWELYEYIGDRLFALDLQNDTVINGISSYLLGAETGAIGKISEITSVTVNGRALPYNGYIDIGLIDTMNDMLTCMLGTLVFIVIAVKDKRGRFASITPALPGWKEKLRF
ncbi:MAG: hypothetical protein IJC48_10730 [Clostridia bacterium]|nr:hypothetical protein [Clostridia bacterium]